MSGYIYVMRAGSYFKIGYTESWPTNRLNQIQISNPEPVYLIGVTAGTMQDEKRLHETYAAKRCHGEWFALRNQDVSAILARGTRIPVQPPRSRQAYVATNRRRRHLPPPQAVRDAVSSLLADAGSGGITGSQVAEALGTSKTTALEHLSALRAAGVAELTGGGRGSRFVIARTDHRRAVADLRARMARITKDAGTADGYLDEGHVWQQA